MKKFVLTVFLCLFAVIVLMPMAAFAGFVGYDIVGAYQSIPKNNEMTFIIPSMVEHPEKVDIDGTVVLSDTDYTATPEANGGVRLTLNKECIGRLAVGPHQLSISWSSIDVLRSTSFCILPEIIAQPQDITVFEGTDATFEIAMSETGNGTGSKPIGMKYQWMYYTDEDPTPIPIAGANTSSLTIFNV